MTGRAGVPARQPQALARQPQTLDRLERFTILPGEAGRTLQRILHDRLGVSHAFARGLLAQDCVRVELRFASRRRYRAPRPARSGPRPEDRIAGARLLHLDDHLVVVDKPAGLLSVPAPGSRLPNLRQALQERLGGPVFAVQRLDRYTSGVMVFARDRETKEALLPQFRGHTVVREYLGVVVGGPAEVSGSLRGRLRQHPRSLKVHPVGRDDRGEEAVTHYQVLQRLGPVSLCRFRLATGKKHQIRAQMAAAGHPLLGDRGYGAPSTLIDRPALHAEVLELSHPLTGEQVRWHAPPPPDLERVIRRARKDAEASAGRAAGAEQAKTNR